MIVVVEIILVVRAGGLDITNGLTFPVCKDKLFWLIFSGFINSFDD
jgi:hypothetical protein